RGVAVDSTGSVYVMDTNNARVQKFTTDGAYVVQFGSFGSDPGQISLALSLALDGDGNVWIADSDNFRVVEFSSAGGFVGHWGALGSAPGQFSTLEGIAVGGTGSPKVYVSDPGNNRVQIFDLTGALQSTIGGLGIGVLALPAGIAVDASQNVYVADSNNQ